MLVPVLAMDAEAPANIVAKFMTAGWLKTEASSSVFVWLSSKLLDSSDPLEAAVTQNVACSMIEQLNGARPLEISCSGGRSPLIVRLMLNGNCNENRKS